jgi:hypothetical protein
MVPLPGKDEFNQGKIQENKNLWDEWKTTSLHSRSA